MFRRKLQRRSGGTRDNFLPKQFIPRDILNTRNAVTIERDRDYYIPCPKYVHLPGQDVCVSIYDAIALLETFVEPHEEVDNTVFWEFTPDLWTADDVVDLSDVDPGQEYVIGLLYSGDLEQITLNLDAPDETLSGL